MLARDGNPTPLGAAITDYGRAAKMLHILAMTDVDDTRRRVVSHQLNLQEGRHRLGRKVFFGRRGQLRQPYRVGQQDQLGSLGLVLYRSCSGTPSTSTPPSTSSVDGDSPPTMPTSHGYRRSTTMPTSHGYRRSTTSTSTPCH
jgi:hypothetical protein